MNDLGAGSLDSDDAVAATLNALNSSLAGRDLPAFMALFEDSDDIVLIGSDVGEVFKGRAAVAGFLKQLFALPFLFSFDMPEMTIRRDANMAWVFVDGAMVHAGADGATRRMPYRFAIVMVKRGSAWRWQLFNGAVPGAE